MAKTPEKNPTKKPFPTEIKGLLFLCISLLLFLSLISFRADSTSSNWLGLAGWTLGFVLTYLFGLCSYPVLLFTGWLGWKALLGKTTPFLTVKNVSFCLWVLSLGMLLNVIAENSVGFSALFANGVYTESHLFDFPYPHQTIRHNLGGVPLYYLYKDLPTFNLQRLLSDFGLGLTSTFTLLVTFFLFTELPLMPLVEALKNRLLAFFSRPKTSEEDAVATPLSSMVEIEKTLSHHTLSPLYPPSQEAAASSEIEKEISESKPSPSKRQLALNAQRVANGDFATYQLPSPSLLNAPKKVDQPSLKKDLKKQADILEETLMSFGIEAKVGDIHCGPTITSFEVHPAVGVKVQKIKTLENDIALNLQAKSIRIIAPIPGKAAVGVEIPSLYPQEVSFKELLLHYQQHSKKMMVPLLMGKTVSGECVISDLAKMPHCLIAGATGSGKSVCINTIIMSILMNARPDEIRLLMIDPKKVELTPYTRLPHMIAPVITEAHGAYAALSWLVKEMQTRYDLFKHLGVRHITAFNHRQINKELEESLTAPVPEKLPIIVAIIDEFADLMMASSSDLETPIARIAQMARAVGIHLILATQRPSREVITGLIKANFPTRVAFKVASRVNSQIILDDTGAESLLGNGDMLFLPPGTSSLTRAQGAYISDDEINQVVSFICDQVPPRYLIESFDTLRPEHLESGDGAEETPRDTLYEQALSLVVETQTASTTYLQRKLKIGYARAASLMDELETKGVIGPQEGAKPRRILLNPPKSGPAHEEQELME